MDTPSPKLYHDLADWWPLLSAPDDYAEEAEFARHLLLSHATLPMSTLLELGSGGGNNALYLKRHFQMTLVDLSPGMLAVSQKLNPECEHRQGDMRTVRLGRLFDGVFIHDAIEYMTTEADLRRALETALVHCRPGGVVLIEPDHVKETFASSTDHGGHDGAGRSLRYLEWTVDPDPNDTEYIADFAILLRESAGSVQVVHDRHVHGLFSRDTWYRLLHELGFQAQSLIDPWQREVFIAVRQIG